MIKALCLRLPDHYLTVAVQNKGLGPDDLWKPITRYCLYILCFAMLQNQRDGAIVMVLLFLFF
jgi:hypothetical protein